MTEWSLVTTVVTTEETREKKNSEGSGKRLALVSRPRQQGKGQHETDGSNNDTHYCKRVRQDDASIQDLLRGTTCLPPYLTFGAIARALSTNCDLHSSPPTLSRLHSFLDDNLRTTANPGPFHPPTPCPQTEHNLF